MCPIVLSANRQSLYKCYATPSLLLQKFVRVFASSEHPLVLFLDDLQWADSASINLMYLLLNDAELHRVCDRKLEAIQKL
ncbi:MAG TPA: AAA family ATPase [Oscillatoriales cyanobacterium M59_W2019_021]|nr:MAG: hypothetical protein D6728_14615 [Cyanobacteria bacterium J055]HIK34028.1 AAA family ATPase [Oscillatoriales cyanobacterium M4454_W2019_049]HIK53173.1 AAA family ATPase [Oscillatoriales cyanobacterium M59_W2019_021]